MCERVGSHAGNVWDAPFGRPVNEGGVQFGSARAGRRDGRLFRRSQVLARGSNDLEVGRADNGHEAFADRVDQAPVAADQSWDGHALDERFTRRGRTKGGALSEIFWCRQKM